MALSSVWLASRLKTPEARAKLVEVVSDRTPWVSASETDEIVAYVIQAISDQRRRALASQEIEAIKREVIEYLEANQ